MSRLDRVMREKDDARKKSTKKKSEIPTFDINGNIISTEKKRKEKRLGIFLLIIAIICVIFYLPGMFMKEASNTESVVVAVDDTAIKKSNDYLKNHPEEDFDQDGIINSEEVQKKMNPWNIDSDGDCLTDPCELNYTSTNPLVSDSEVLINAQKKLDKEKGKSLGSPYKIGNVILWAKDYTSKAIGSVVETPTGYRFCGFEGYAQFPEEDGKYAYRVRNNVHSLLNYKEKENVWEVHNGDEVELYDKPLTETIEFAIFGKKFYGPANAPMKLLEKIMPSRGIFTANLKMRIDVEPDTNDIVTAEIDTPVFMEDSNFRFGKNNNSLNDLLYVRNSISKGSCIAVSLYNENEGEYVGVIYGYDANGNFLIADQDSLKPVGTLTIKETAYKMMNETGEIVSISYFDFSGFWFRNSQGEMQVFSSLYGDHISFFAASTGDGSGSQLLEDHLKDIVDESEETTEEQKVGNDALEEIKKQKEAEAAATATEEEVTEATTEATEAPVDDTTETLTDTPTEATEAPEEATTESPS